MEIKWRDVVGYENLYQVSNTGIVRSLFRYKKELKPNITNSGYATVQLFKNKVGKRLLIHRIVATSFIVNSKNLPQVNHKDEDKLNNCVDNLEWCSARENMNHGTRLKRQLSSCKNYYESDMIKEIAIKNGKKVMKPVLQLSKSGVVIARYNSVKEAGMVNGILPTKICDALKGRHKTSGGFVWKYERGNDLLACQC